MTRTYGTASASDSQRTSVQESADNPFPGPKPYRRGQSDLFFGRRREIEELTSLVVSSSAVLLYARSGSGKSSLLQAGLIPALVDFGMAAFPIVRLARPDDRSAPGAQPSPNLFMQLVAEAIDPEHGSCSPASDLVELLSRLRAADGSEAVLVLDQFEELFSMPSLWSECGEFLTQVRRALDAHQWLHVVIAIRSDFVTNLVPYQRQLPGRLLVHYGLESLDEIATREVIRETFARTEVSLSPPELEMVLDRLFELDPGPRRPVPIRIQHVNLIQLQIVCRRLWNKKVKLSTMATGEAGATQLLSADDVDLHKVMRGFVDDAIVSVIGSIQCDEAILRRWLEDRLITAGGRRAALLVEDQESGDLPKRLVDALESARLIQLEQRNDSRWAELTHDSMVGAVRDSNAEWVRASRRTRRRLTACLSLLLLALVALFPLLHDKPDYRPIVERAGLTSDSPVRVEFPALGPGRVAFVHANLQGPSGASVTVRVLAIDGGTEQTVAVRSTSDDDPLTIDKNVYEVFVTEPRKRYSVEITTSPEVVMNYRLLVAAVPILINAEGLAATPTVDVSSSKVAIELSSTGPTIVTIQGGLLSNAFGGKVLAEGYSYVIFDQAARESYAILEIQEPYGPGLTSNVRLRGSILPPQPTGLQLDAAGDLSGRHAAIGEFGVTKRGAAYAVEASCGGRMDVTVLDASGKGLNDAVLLSHESGSFESLLPSTLPPGKYRVVVHDPTDSDVKCTLRVRSFNRIIGTGSSVAIDAGKIYNLYPVKVPEDSAIIMTGLSGVRANLDCEGEIADVTQTGAGRLVAFAPGNRDCLLTLTRAEDGELLRQQSFVRIVPIEDE